MENTSDAVLTSHYPDRLIGDRAYDSDAVDENVYEKYGTKVTSPRKVSRHKTATQDGRELRHYV